MSEPYRLAIPSWLKPVAAFAATSMPVEGNKPIPDIDTFTEHYSRMMRKVKNTNNVSMQSQRYDDVYNYTSKLVIARTLIDALSEDIKNLLYRYANYQWDLKKYPSTSKPYPLITAANLDTKSLFAIQDNIKPILNLILSTDVKNENKIKDYRSDEILSILLNMISPSLWYQATRTRKSHHPKLKAPNVY